MRLTIVVALVSATAMGASLVHGRQLRQPEVPCSVTVPDASDGAYGNALLSTWLWPDGTIVFKPGGPGFVTSDGALGMKFGWTRGLRGKLIVAGHRLDGAAGRVTLETKDGYGDVGFQPSYLIFAAPGCWEITAQVGERAESRITFVTSVMKIGEGPAWRRDPFSD